MKKPPKIEIIHRYGTDDADCSGDYCGVTVKIGGNKVRQYGDHYHDKGTERAEAFVDGFLHSQGDDSNLSDRSERVVRTDKADYKL